LQSFVPLLEDDDPRKRADIYTEDATFVMPGTPVIQGRADIDQSVNGIAATSGTNVWAVGESAGAAQAEHFTCRPR